MLTYQNLSNTTKTFHGVKFNPGDIKEVPGAINHSQFIRVKSVLKEPPKQAEVKQEDAAVKPDNKKEKNVKPAADDKSKSEMKSMEKSEDTLQGGE